MAEESGQNQSERHSVLAAAQKDWNAFKFAAESCKGDRDIILAAVKQSWRALEYAAESFRGDRAIVLAAIEQNWQALKFAAENCKGDHDIVLAVVQRSWRALELAAESCRGDRAIVLAAVKQDGQALQFAAESCRGDRAIVLAAVKQDGFALKYAAERCRDDREIVLEAVKQYASPLEFAGKSCRGDREIVLAAVKQYLRAFKELATYTKCRNDLEAAMKANLNQLTNPLEWASDELIEDSSFAVDLKKEYHILKISMISGRQVLIFSRRVLPRSTGEVLQECCKKLGISSTGSMCLVSGDDVVRARDVHDWPGIRDCGESSEYQLVVQQS